MRGAFVGAVAVCACALGCDAGGGGSPEACTALVPDTGACAADYLTGATYSSLEIEVDFLDGPALEPDRYRPDPEALRFLVQELDRRLRKPGGMTVTLDDRIPGNEAHPPYGIQDLQAIEARYRTGRSGDAPGVAVLYIVYLDGPIAISSGLLGANFGTSAVAVFDETLRGVASLPEDRQRAEKMLLLHEAGHVLGLVNIATPQTTSHADRRSPCHDVDPACVMFHRIETSLVGSLGAAPLTFDRACQEDLEASGGLPPDP